MKIILLNVEGLQTRVAVVEDGRLEDYFIERTGSGIVAGSIYKARVSNLEPSLQAAFVDIGAQKNAFLHYWDMLPATMEMLEGGGKAGDDEEGYDDDEEEEEQESDSAAEPGESLPKGGRSGRLLSLFRRRAAKSEAETESASSAREGSSRDASGGGGRSRGRRGGGKRRPRQPAFTVEDIPNLFKANSDVIVQVTKAPIGTKGARVTTNISLAGRYLVLLPHSPHVGISKRIADREERNRLRQVLRKLKLPKGMGLICRTVGEGVSEKEFQDDLSELLERWRSAEATAEKERAPACLYREPDLVERTLRDWMTEDVDEIVADSREIHKTAQDLVRRYSQKRIRVRLHNSPTPLFQKCNVSQQVENVFSRQVPLPSGGYLTVDETEALVAIDVNSGKNRGGKNHPETILSTNLEACEEIARQLRLRNVGGLVVLDLIDMRSRKDQQAVYRAFRTHMKRDRARNRILPISPLGLIEMTRQREHESVRDTVYGPCPYCHGRGLVKSSASMSVEIQRRLAELLRRRGQRQIRVMVHPQVLARLKNEDADLLAEMEEEFGGELSFRAEEGLHVEEFRVVDQRSGKEL